jgi:hypothetical protein
VVAVTTPDPPATELTAELRALAEALLEKVQPWLVTAAQQPAASAADACGWCPVCALVAGLRGESTELGRRLAEQGSGVLTAVRTLLEEHDGATHAAGRPAPAEPAPVQVLRIPVRRTGGGR